MAECRAGWRFFRPYRDSTYSPLGQPSDKSLGYCLSPLPGLRHRRTSLQFRDLLPKLPPLPAFGFGHSGQSVCAAGAVKTYVVLPLPHFKQHAVACFSGLLVELQAPAGQVRLQPIESLCAKAAICGCIEMGGILPLAATGQRPGTGGAIRGCLRGDRPRVRDRRRRLRRRSGPRRRSIGGSGVGRIRQERKPLGCQRAGYHLSISWSAWRRAKAIPWPSLPPVQPVARRGQLAASLKGSQSLLELAVPYAKKPRLTSSNGLVEFDASRGPRPLRAVFAGHAR